MGISSIKVSTVVGAILMAIGAVWVAGSGMVMRGCVFFISTTGAGRTAGSGNKEIRAVSFLGPAEEATLVATGAGFGIKGGMPAGGAELPEEGGTGGLRKVGGAATGLAGGGGSGVCA